MTSHLSQLNPKTYKFTKFMLMMIIIWDCFSFSAFNNIVWAGVLDDFVIVWECWTGGVMEVYLVFTLSPLYQYLTPNPPQSTSQTAKSNKTKINRHLLKPSKTSTTLLISRRASQLLLIGEEMMQRYTWLREPLMKQ